MYSALAVANWFLKRGKFDPVKLQKLAFFAHGWRLALRDRPLINEEVEAWKYGPVFPTLYHKLKKYGSSPIGGPVSRHSIDETTGEIVESIPIVRSGDTDTQRLLEKILEVYGHLPATRLSSMTHHPDSPWTKVWNEEGHKMLSTDIPREAIQKYFKDQLGS